MTDEVKVTNWPKDGGEARVAYDLWLSLRSNLPDGPKGIERIKQQIDFYEVCRAAAGNHRIDYSGLK